MEYEIFQKSSAASEASRTPSARGNDAPARRIGPKGVTVYPSIAFCQYGRLDYGTGGRQLTFDRASLAFILGSDQKL
jgi:hypothetical protein